MNEEVEKAIWGINLLNEGFWILFGNKGGRQRRIKKKQGIFGDLAQILKMDK